MAMQAFLNSTGKTDSSPAANRVFDYIVKYKMTHDGCAPGLRDIVQACGLSSTSVAYYHLRRLESQGRIRLTDFGVRQIAVVGGRLIWEGNHEQEESL